jgi:threonine dehydrogenase-like Zn-dependent dehydrogenase
MPALRFRIDLVRYGVAYVLGKRTPVWLPPLSLEPVSVPEAAPGWTRAAVRLCGVCGSDMGLLFGRLAPSVSAFYSFPAVLGHEILADVDGTRIAVNPTLACADRGVAPCDACRRGDDNLCVRIADGPLASGMLIGFQRDLPGGWGSFVTARAERLHPIPDGVSDDRAVLAEPFAVAWRAARKALRTQPRKVLVIGSGTIGLAVVVALRLVGYAGEIHVVARRERLAQAARRAGADHVHGSTRDAREAVGARPFPARLGPPAWRGGFDLVVDAAGNRATLQDAAWTAREGGAVLLVAGPGHLVYDLSPHWLREVDVVSTYTYRADEFAEAVAALPAAGGLDAIGITRYPLGEYRAALADVQGRRVQKAAFSPAV